MEGKGLGFRPGPEDERDYMLAPRVQAIERPKTKGGRWWFNPLRLNQGAQGSCVGHGWTQGINSQPKSHNYDHEFAVAIYKSAQQLDEFDDTPPEEGTSVRAGAKACQKQNLITNYAFTNDVEELAMWVLNKGPVVIGVDWYAGMDHPTKDNDYYVEPTGRVRGGHCLLIDGVRWNGDDRDYFRLLNSWGGSNSPSGGWGLDGRCRIRVPDLESLLNADSGVACTSIES
jgi:hypothetical protein